MIHVISGLYPKKKLFLPNPSVTRPTSQCVKESIFNILMHRLQFEMHTKRVLDGFAGSGSLGIEAVSRGAGTIYFLENDPSTIRILRKNIGAVKTHGVNCRIYTCDIHAIPPQKSPVDLIFLDPPYKMHTHYHLISILRTKGWISEHTIIVFEHHKMHPIDLLDIQWTRLSITFYADTCVTIFHL